MVPCITQDALLSPGCTLDVKKIIFRFWKQVDTRDFKYLLRESNDLQQNLHYSRENGILTCIGLVLESGDVMVSTGFSLPFKVSQSVSARKYMFFETLLVHFQMLVISRLYVYGK